MTVPHPGAVAPVALSHVRRGTGEPLVLLHPLGADRLVWEPVLPLLGERDVIAVDMPGFGASPPLDATPTPRALAAAVGRFVGELGLERPHIAGNSLGAWVAMELALLDAVRSVTVIAPAGLWAQPLMPKRGLARRAAQAILPAAPLLARSPRGRAALLVGTVAHPERVPPAAAVHLVEAYARAPGFQAANDAMRADRFRGLHDIRVPLTMAWPDRDRLVSRPRDLPAAARVLPLPGCGHVPMWDDPAAVAGVLLAGSAVGS